MLTYAFLAAIGGIPAYFIARNGRPWLGAIVGVVLILVVTLATFVAAGLAAGNAPPPGWMLAPGLVAAIVAPWASAVLGKRARK